MTRFTETMRGFHARVWRESRRDLFEATSEQRSTIRVAWAAWRGPLTSIYFRYIVDLHTGVMARRSDNFNSREKVKRSAVIERRDAQASLNF